METKSKNKKLRVKLYLITLTSCIVLSSVLAVLAIPETALAKKPVDDTTYYTVTMTGDLEIVGAFNDGNLQPLDWGRSFETGIMVNHPRPKICFATAFLQTGGVTLKGEPCGDGVIPGDDGPNWGTLFVSGDDTGVTVGYKIGESDGKTGKLRRYALKSGPGSLVTSGSGIWPNGEGTGTVYTVTIPAGMSWSLVEERGDLNTTLTSTQDTIITFTEYTGS